MVLGYNSNNPTIIVALVAIVFEGMAKLDKTAVGAWLVKQKRPYFGGCKHTAHLLVSVKSSI